MKEKALYWLVPLVTAILLAFAQVAKRERPVALPHAPPEPQINEEPMGSSEPELSIDVSEPDLPTAP